MAGKQSSIRLVSSRTTAPSAPSTRSSQRNAYRSWPGVPNRYSRSDSSRLIRPKSSATVVVTLPGTRSLWSTPAAAVVMSASVSSGSISEIDPTNVVFPTPKPPLITIFTETGELLEGADTVADPLHHLERELLAAQDGDHALGDEVGHQHAD